MDRKHLYFFGGTFLVLLALFALSRRSSEGFGPGLEGVILSSVAGTKTVDLGRCSGEKCLTMYVAPWCDVCRASTALLKEFSAYLSARNIETRIVVGRGSPGDVRDYALEFGPDTLVDPGSKVPLDGGVPNFMVSTPTGKIVKSFPGVPGIVSPPIPPELLRQMGESLGLLEPSGA